MVREIDRTKKSAPDVESMVVSQIDLSNPADKSESYNTIIFSVMDLILLHFSMVRACGCLTDLV